MNELLARALAVFIAAALLPIEASGQIVSYVDSSTYDAQKGKLNLQVGGSALGLQAGVDLLDERDGKSRIKSSLTTSWAPLAMLDVKTVFQYADLSTNASDPTVNTSLTVKPDLNFLERVDASVQRADNRSKDSLQLQFANLSTGLDLVGGDPLRFRSDMKIETIGERTVAYSNLESTMGFGRAFKLRSVLHLDDRAGAGLQRSALDTRLSYTTPFAYIARIEGEIHRGLDGERRMLSMQMTPITGGTPYTSSFKLTGKVLVRENVRTNGEPSRHLGIETKFSGVMPSWLGGENSLSLKLERGLGYENLRNATLAYNHEWKPAEQARIELKLNVRRKGERLDSSMDLAWSARF